MHGDKKITRRSIPFGHNLLHSIWTYKILMNTLPVLGPGYIQIHHCCCNCGLSLHCKLFHTDLYGCIHHRCFKLEYYCRPCLDNFHRYRGASRYTILYGILKHACRMSYRGWMLQDIHRCYKPLESWAHLRERHCNDLKKWEKWEKAYGLALCFEGKGV